jgi:3-oxoacyl-(acyl-carrier-protein) synthase
MREPLAITGVGVWSCFGRGVEALMAALFDGRRGLRRARELPNIDDPWLATDQVASIERPPGATAAAWLRTLAIETGGDAWRDAGLGERAPCGPRTAIVIGSSHDASDLLLELDAQRARGHIDPMAFVETSAAAGRELGRRLGASGPNIAISSGCSSALHALGHAIDMMRSDRIDLALVGAHDALTAYTLAGFNNLRLLDRQGPRPFGRDARGLVLGDGAAMFVLERAATARARGARIWALVSGYGTATELRGGSLFDPQGTRALAAMQAALATDPEPRDLRLVCAHATGAPAADAAELAAITRLVGEAALPGPVHVTSIKGHVGDPLAASGGLEVAAALAAMRAAVIPATLGLTDALVPGDARVRLAAAAVATPIPLALCNSFGFGGSLASVALRRAADHVEGSP